MDLVIIVTAVVCAIGLICNAYVAGSVMKNIGKIGNLPQIKSQTISRSLFNMVALACLAILVLGRVLNYFDNQLFIGIFVLILGGLGFKITSELFFNSSRASHDDMGQKENKCNKNS